MKKLMLPILLAATAATSLATPAAADELAVDLTGGGLYYRGSFQNFGWSFTLSETVAVTALGIYDYQADGLVDVHQVGLWDASHSLLATAMLDSSDPLTADAGGGWRLKSIPALILGPGTYVLGAHYTTEGDTGDYFVGNATFVLADGLSFGETLVTLGEIDGFHEPDTASSVGALGYFGPTMRIAAVPEPASWALMVAGLGLAGGALRGRRKVAGAFA